MFRSVFSKYITAFMLIIVLSFTILAVIIGSLLVNYSMDSKRNAVSNAASTVKFYLETDFTGATSDEFNRYINFGKKTLRHNFSIIVHYTGDLSILVLSTEGKVLMTDETTSLQAGYTHVSEETVKKINRGDFHEVTDLDGLLEQKRLMQGIPVTVNGQNVGIVLTGCAPSGITDVLQVMLRTIVMASIWVLMATLIAVYFISDRIISPLKEMSVAAKCFAQGQFDVRVPVTGHDEVSELALAFNNMAASLENVETMRRSFIANVSHELRTPMTSIAGFVDSMLDGAIPPEKYGQYLKVISTEVHRLSRLVTSLLDISRIQAGERKFNKSAFDVCEMAREILISLEQRIESKKLDVEFDCQEDSVYAYADRDAIYQILYNICDNAVKFSREGGKYRIRILDRDKKLYVSVYNEGVGIPAEDLPFVFDRFYKSDKSRSLDKTGVGLGLYIAKTVIDAHGEEIWVKSAAGEYCEFVFTLTRAHDNQVKKSEKENGMQPE